MSVQRYPEWFIDGPMHGEDRLVKFPGTHTMIRCVLPRPLDVRMLIDPGTVDLDDAAFDEYTYVPKYVDVFGERLCIWISVQNAADPGEPGNEADWLRMLGQLIMAPHRDGSDIVQRVADRHRLRWDVEHEVRRSVNGEMRALKSEIARLKGELLRAQTQRVLNETNAYEPFVPPNTAKIALKDDVGEEAQAFFENIVLFFDEGDGTAENPPSWIATAAGLSGTPCTGYGTSKKAAIIALLADGLGVYARMIEFSEERIK